MSVYRTIGPTLVVELFEGAFNQINTFFFIRVWVNVVYRAEKNISGQTSCTETYNVYK